MKSFAQNLVLFASLVVVPSFAFAHNDKPHAAPKPATVEAAAQPAVAVVEAFSKALQAGDLKRAGALLAPDVLILESGGAERSREEYLGNHAISDAAFLKGAHVQVKQRTARVQGALAWVGTESEIHATKDGKPLTLRSTETMILKKTGNDWRIVHIHWSSRPKKEYSKIQPAAASDNTQIASVPGPAWMPASDRIMLVDAQGAGMAMAADAHGWPGPKHVLDLAEKLELSTSQRLSMQQLMGQMRGDAIALGEEILEAEQRLDREFSRPATSRSRILALSEHIGRLRGRLRAVHLEAHVQAATLLTQAQRQHYMQLRSGDHAHGASS